MEDKPQDPVDEMGRKVPVVVVKGVFQLSRSLVAKRHSQVTVTQSGEEFSRTGDRV